MFRSLSRSILPEVDTAASIEEMQRLQEKQKLLNMSMDYNTYSPISLTSTHPHHYGSTPEMYDDPWGIHRHVQKHEPMMYGIKQETSYDSLPMMAPLFAKSNSINPFHTEIAPSAMLFPYDAQQTQIQATYEQQQQIQDDLFTSPASFIDSDDDDDMEQSTKRQRGEHHNIIYVKQEQAEDQDIPTATGMDTTSFPQQPMLLSQPSSNVFVDYTATAATSLEQLYNHTQQQQQTPVPFTLDPQVFTLAPVSILSNHNMSIASSSSSSSRRGSIDSYPSDDGKQQRKRKSSSTSTSQRKSQPIGTHAIENTGAPVKMAKYLQVDALQTQVWIEHATYEEKGITTDVRMIMYSGAFNGVVVHAGDVGERIVCNRRSNISREFGQYSSTVELTEKILIRIPSEHRPLGQTGNVLTGYGLIRFLQSKKMRKPENQTYRRWLLQHVYGLLQLRPFTFPVGHPLETRTTPVTPFTEADFSY